MLEIHNFNSKSYLDAILNLTNDLVIFLNTEGIIIEFSRLIEKYYGWTRSDFVGKNFNSLLKENAKYVPFSPEIYANLHKVNYLKFERVVNLKGSESRVIEWSITSVKKSNNITIGFIFIGRDITDKITLEKQNRQIQSYLENISDSMPGNFYWKDKKGYYLGCNRLLLHTLGFSSMKDIVGKTDYDLWPNQAEELLGNDKRVMDSGKPISLEETVKMENEGEMYFAVIKIPLLNEEGNIVGIIGNSLDITELKETQLALKEAKEKAEAVSQAKSEFITNMNHDLRTPLTGIIGMAESIVYESQEPRIKEYADDIQKSGERLLEFVNDILETAQIDIKDTSDQLQIVNLKQIGQEIKELFKPSLLKKNIHFNLNYDDQIPMHLTGNSTLIHRILLNLLGNAIKFTASGEISLTVKCLKIEKEQIFVELSMKDTGIGIAKDKHELIFEPFKKLSSSDQGIYKGNGLGLYIVKQLVEKLEGNIKVKSKPGKGATFIVTIPLLLADEESLQANRVVNNSKATYQEVSAKPAVSQQVKIQSRQYRVLAVEDDEIAGKVLLMRLRELNCHVDLAVSGESAIHKAKNAKYDFIYMDVGLPDISGSEATRAIRRWEKETGKQPVPIIALTAHVDKAGEEKCLAAGLTLVLNKPISRATIEQHIKRYLDNISEKSADSSEAVTSPKAEKQELTEKLSIMLSEAITDELPTIHRYYQSGNWNDLRMIIHRFNGSASYCGDQHLKLTLSQLEKSLAGESREESTIKNCFEVFLSDVDRFVKSYSKS